MLRTSFLWRKDAMQKVYNDVVGIATVAAVVCSAVCLFLMNFSKSGKTVDESRTWLKRIVICWAVLNGTWSDCKLHGSSRSTAELYWLKNTNIPEPSREKEVDEVSWAGY